MSSLSAHCDCISFFLPHTEYVSVVVLSFHLVNYMDQLILIIVFNVEQVVDGIVDLEDIGNRKLLAE